MPVVDTTMQNECLDAILGPDRASHMPDSYGFELWDGDPRNEDSAEIDTGEVLSIGADDFGPADGGQTTATAVVAGTAVDAFSDTATHYVMRHPVSEGIAFCAPLQEPLDVTGPGDWSVQPIVYFADPD